MLRAASRVVQAAELPAWENNLVVETALRHVRNLGDLYGVEQRARADDLLALNYSPGWTPQRIMGEHWRQRINKRLHHLTVARAEKAGGYPFVVWINRADGVHRQLVRLVRETDTELALALDDHQS
jgi:hypothetical protein